MPTPGAAAGTVTTAAARAPGPAPGLGVAPRASTKTPYPPVTSSATTTSTAHHRRRARSVTVQVRGLGVRVRRVDRPDDPTAPLVGEVHLHQLALSQLVEYLGVGGAKAQAVAQRDHVLGTVDRADGADRLAAVVRSEERRVGKECRSRCAP